MVISMNCSKAMTVTNYNELANLVSTQKTASLHATRYNPKKTAEGRNRTLDNRARFAQGAGMPSAKREQVCSREACPASMEHTPQKQSVKLLKRRLDSRLDG